MWQPGQRVLAPTEPELGVGRVKACDGRTVDVEFESAGLVRRYAARSAPLKRMQWKPGHTASTRDGRAFVVAEVREEGGLYRYLGEGLSLLESELGDRIPDRGLVDLFVQGPWSEPRTYDMRRAGWELLNRSLDPDIRGLVGTRVSLLPHQLFIADRIAKREYPRVLLADEVGLGKTIEAGLIFSSLRALDRAQRVLVLAPRALKHQWLSELYRRFGELFNVIDLDGEKLEDDIDFTSSHKNLSSLEFLMSDMRWIEEAAAEPWDLLIVDEAHHLEWTADEASAEWEIVRLLSERSRGLLLLTATPRQAGLETQFGLLHLVDPQRFADYDKFCEEAEELRATADLARRVEAGEKGAAIIKELEKRFGDDPDLIAAAQDLGASGPERLLNALVDRHGTGRVLMRNRRDRLKGFPARKLHAVPLESAEARVAWLAELLNGLKPGEKILLLCATDAQVRKLDTALREKTGVKRALFHEKMDIVERDRQAAWFADPKGAQILLSSEIGGEGRNFQFARALVLYDLPTHPDLLEQRIGRLDRIGRTREVEVYVPYLENTAEEVYFEWYARALRSFERASSGGAALLEAFEEELTACAEAFSDRKVKPAEREKLLEGLIERASAEAERIEQANRESVDLLVDLNSFDPKRGEELRRKVAAADDDTAVRDYMEAVFDHYGVEAEDFDDHGTLKLSAHSLTFIESFPELPPGSEILATYDRMQALAREDLKLLNQDHPMVKGALSLLLDREEGRVSVAAGDKLTKGGRQFEFFFVLQAKGLPVLELERYLPVTLLEVIVDDRGQARILDEARDASAELQRVWRALPEDTERQLAESYADRLPGWAEKASELAAARAGELVTRALKLAEVRLSEEQARLEQLRRVNKSVRNAEVEAHKKRMAQVQEALKAVTPRLDALRLVL